jgi:hypothetical protein
MIEQGQTISFKTDLLTGIQNLSTDTLKMALYVEEATLNKNTTEYTTTNETVGTGYTAGGKTLTGVTISSDTASGVVYISFNNVVWDPAEFTCRGALIYNSTRSNKSIAVVDFGSAKTTTTTFTVAMPVNSPTTALLRLT